MTQYEMVEKLAEKIFMTRADKAMYDDKNKRKYGRRKDDCVKMSGLMEKAMDSKMK